MNQFSFKRRERITLGGAKRSILTACLVSVAVMTATPVLGQDSPPPERPEIDANGVDITSGRLQFLARDLAIGPPEAGGLVLDRFSFSNLNVAHTYDITWDGGYVGMGQDAGHYFTSITYGGLNLAFVNTEPRTANGDYLEGLLQTAARLVGRDGTITHFTQVSAMLVAGGTQERYLASQIVRPNGEVINLTYQTTTSSTGPKWRLRSVTNNFGYQLIFDYQTQVYSSGWYWTRPIKVTAINNAYERCEPTSATCVLTQAWPAVTYSAPHASPAYVISPAGETITSSGGVWYSQTIQSSADSRPRVQYSSTLLDQNELRVSTVTTEDGVWQYSYTLLPRDSRNKGLPNQVTVRSPDLQYTTYNYLESYSDSMNSRLSFRPPILTSIETPTGRTTSFEVDAHQRITRVIQEEGNSWQYQLDARGNRLTTTRNPKPGSGLAPIVTTSAYPATCGNPVTCNRPTSVTDANGNVTTYTYDPVHGGILVETSPPVNGVSAVKRYGYVQRRAWVLNPAGGYQALPYVWLLSEVRTCRTSATSGNACAAGPSDEIVTSYDYGPDSGPNNLLLRGVVVQADGLVSRTCYAYDRMGRRTSETSPAAYLGACS